MQLFTASKAACLAAIALFSAAASAAVVGKTVTYDYQGRKMRGFLAYDDAWTGKQPRPGVLVVHEWWGLNDYIRGRTKQVAGFGYVAFAPDMYGDGKTTRDPKEAESLSTAAHADLAARAKAGLDVLRRQKLVDKSRIGAMGFCFGGSTVLALAYSGEPLRGVVTFHGSLFPPDEKQRMQIRTPILILHGEKDPFVKPETIAQVRDALDAGNVDWYMVTYARAVHAFTNPEADRFKIEGIAYDPKAATRSWDEMRRFFKTQLDPGR